MKIDIAQARKRAKELVKSGQAATLADAQLRIARELGYTGWPALLHATVRPATFFPGPGEFRTYVTVWEVDDPTKAGDPRYWWLPDEVDRLRLLVPPEFADKVAVAGTPKGQTLVSVREEFGVDEEATFEPFAPDPSVEESRSEERRVGKEC